MEEVDKTSSEDRRVRVNLITTYRNMDGKDKADPGLLLDLVADGAKNQAIRGVHAMLNIPPSTEPEGGGSLLSGRMIGDIFSTQPRF